MAHSIDLFKNLEKQALRTEIANVVGVHPDSALAVVNTVHKLYGRQSISPTRPEFIPSSLLLVNKGASISSVTQSFLKDLVIAAQEAAVSIPCSSFLAGSGSESDEFGDVTLWLGEGEYGKGHGLQALRSLGLDEFSYGSSQIGEVDLSSDSGLPSYIEKGNSEKGSLAKVVQALGTLREKYAFYVKSEGGIVVYVLLGHLENSHDSGWAGLLGLGVWSDS